MCAQDAMLGLMVWWFSLSTSCNCKLWLICKWGWLKTEHTWSSHAYTVLIVERHCLTIQVLIEDKFGVSFCALKHKNLQHTQQARLNHMRGQDLGLCCTSHTFHSASSCCQVPFGGFLRVYWELIRMISRVGTMRLIEWVHVNCFHELSQVWSYSDCKPNLNICEDFAENQGLMGSVLGGLKLIYLCLGFRVC